MEWLIAWVTYAGTKVIDFFFGRFKGKRDFKTSRKEQAVKELEELKDEVGRLYELSLHRVAFEDKRDRYVKAFDNEPHLIGKYNKYPEIAAAARDVFEWCKFVFADERDKSDNLRESQSGLVDKYKSFIKSCEKYIDGLG